MLKFVKQGFQFPLGTTCQRTVCPTTVYKEAPGLYFRLKKDLQATGEQSHIKRLDSDQDATPSFLLFV